MHTDENGRSDELYSNLTDKQLKTLLLIKVDQDASKSELADEFDVTRATISHWLSDMPGFEWTDRHEHASEILNNGGIREPVEQEFGRSDPLNALRQRLDAFERRLDEMETGPEAESMGIDPELAHKVVHASMQSDLITKEEELQLFRDLLGPGTYS